MHSPERMAVPCFSRVRVLCCAPLALLAMVAFPSWANAALSIERVLTVDDFLKLSSVGKAAARPGRDTFVWEQSSPYDTLEDYGTGTTGTWQGSDYEIITMESGSGAPRKLFQPQARTTYLLGNFSNDGRFLTLLATRDGKVRVDVYDYRRRKLTEYPLAPQFPPLVPNPDWAWLDNRHLAIAAYPDGDGPWPLTFRRGIGSRLMHSWEKSWQGKEASVDQYDSSATDIAQPLPGRLVVVDVESGDIQQLASGQFSALRPSPDGRWLAAVRQSKLPQASLEHPRIDWTYARSALAIFSLTGDRSERDIAPDLDVLPDSMEWNPLNNELAFFAWHAGTGLRSGNFWIADPLRSAAKSVPHAGLSLESQRARGGPQWPERAVWLHDSLAVFAHSSPGQPGSLAFEDIESNEVVDPRVAVGPLPAHWYLLTTNSAPRDLTPGMQKVSPIPLFADESRVAVAADGQAWELDASGPPTLLFPEIAQRLDASANRSVFQPKTNGGKGFIPIAGAPGRLAQIGLKGGSPTLKLLDTPPETLILAVSNSGSALARIGVGKGAQMALIHPGGEPSMLGELNPILDSIIETRWTDFKYSNAEGSARLQLTGCLMFPAGYKSGRKYPLIVDVYPDRPGGCAAPEQRARFAMAAGGVSTAYSEHLLSARGFVVFRPDAAGGISRTPDGPQAALPAVVDRGVDAVLAAGYADPARVGLIGFSQGGFASLWVATQSPRYKAVVSLNGWSDLADNFFQMSWSQQFAPTEMSSDGEAERYLTPAGSHFSMGVTPWKSPLRYVQNSPLWRSDGVSAPVLLIHSDMDEFPDAGYMAFFTSLYIQKKDARLLIYRGEGHSPSSPANIRHMWKNIFSWFDKYLDVKRDPAGNIVIDK
jgi:dipeptidyl aminopeptidase/acylaminoacyl peptidase